MENITDSEFRAESQLEFAVSSTPGPKAFLLGYSAFSEISISQQVDIKIFFRETISPIYLAYSVSVQQFVQP